MENICNVALGISGEVQHGVGFRAATTVVAIHADPGSAIARFADLMVVGDLHAIVPLLIERMRAARRV